MILDLKKHSVPNMRKHLRIAMIGVSLMQWPCRTDWTPSIFLSVLGVKFNMCGALMSFHFIV